MKQQSLSYFYIYQDTRQTWNWRLMSRGGRVIAVNPAGYDDLNTCREDIKQMTLDAGLAVCVGDNHYMRLTM
ncbi:hypothetical protein CYR40_21395 [Chimaeribacter arupi]|uniref:DUF1508 domain-containing protein n=2 Tax=Yersiniaceae TaxID=1903411 RepID=A0A2N5EH90_9GAMM|nr:MULTISPECIES: hypothetical protein [Yersiniaceae]MBS0968698.1 hypothetical protein [Nissabacter archeti]MDV5139681.1 hypothetical protein [Chimaeribacter arupi]PLR29695.1 hypothetical protein CYR23_19785 [Chimaeribacter arupi]PLR42152.1 hypothetical protein CYR40_21395 [Chimaeribacter arupi]PLR42900.1 hypothetical protein CYR52_20615 [Chimaeribacter arupi]